MDKKIYALGLFDSMHKGHRALIEKGKTFAKELNAELCVVTFDDELCGLLSKTSKEVYLLREREEIIKSLGINEVKVLPGSKDFLQTDKKDFLKLLSDFNPAGFVVGSDYKFGRNAAGDANLLKDYFSDKGVAVTICPLELYNGEKISTTEIKLLLSEGKIKEANYLLDAPFFFTGTVVEGLKNGRKLGLPTANIDFDGRKFIPKEGVYMTKTIVDGRTYLSVTNIGMHPTINTEKANLESHILDFDSDIYKKDIKIEFYKYIRGVIRFKNADELKAQIAKDIDNTRNELSL